jgi:hypothetical protein
LGKHKGNLVSTEMKKKTKLSTDFTENISHQNVRNVRANHIAVDKDIVHLHRVISILHLPLFMRTPFRDVRINIGAFVLLSVGMKQLENRRNDFDEI